jgi:hypothetical protein
VVLKTIDFITPALSLAVLVQCVQGDVIHRRGGESSISGEVSSIDEAGVTIRRKDVEPEMIRWDRIREVKTDRPRPELDRYRHEAINLWRARSRLERSDFEMAEPLFERLFEKYRGQKNETALVVAEGLLRCKLARGSNDSAIIPALEAIRLRRSVKNAATVYSILRPVIDARTGLCMELPPVWVNSTALTRVERDLGSYDAQGDTIVAAQAALHRLAIQQQMGITPAPIRELAANDPGVSFLKLVVQAQGADSNVRQAARKELEQLMPKLEPWESSWAHFALGISMLRDDDLAIQESGMVHLAHLPSSFSQSQPYLAGLAIEALATACERVGDSTGATALRADLRITYANHPIVLELPPAPSRSTSTPTTRSDKDSS